MHLLIASSLRSSAKRRGGASAVPQPASSANPLRGFASSPGFGREAASLPTLYRRASLATALRAETVKASPSPAQERSSCAVLLRTRFRSIQAKLRFAKGRSTASLCRQAEGLLTPLRGERDEPPAHH